MAHKVGTYEEHLAQYDILLKIIDEVVASEQCFKISDLAINGHDIIQLGIPEGVLIGKILRDVLNKVINGELENDKYELIKWVRTVNN